MIYQIEIPDEIAQVAKTYADLWDCEITDIFEDWVYLQGCMIYTLKKKYREYEETHPLFE